MGGQPLRILFLTFYFRPDLCAGSFRATPLLHALVQRAPPGSHVDVVTTQPNRYKSFLTECPEIEDRCGHTIFRVPLPQHQSGMLDQSRAFAAFARGALRIVSARDYDLVFATSSRLMTAVLAAWIARAKGARLYLDMRDIFVDTIGDVLPRNISWLVKPGFSAMERFAIGRAEKVNLISAGFADYFTRRYPAKALSYFTNGVDDEFVCVARSDACAARPRDARGPLSVLYAGNIGEGQGLHAIVPALAARLASRARFTIIGDGGRKRELETELASRGVSNVELLAPLGRDALIDAYRNADVLFMHLNRFDAFRKVLPSKVFEYAALGKPVWAGVAGYAAQFVNAEVANAAVFEPCDVEGAVRALDTLKIEDRPRTDFVEKFARSSIDRRMAADIIGVAEAPG